MNQMSHLFETFASIFQSIHRARHNHNRMLKKVGIEGLIGIDQIIFKLVNQLNQTRTASTYVNSMSMSIALQFQTFIVRNKIIHG